MRLRSKLSAFVLVLVVVGAGATILVSHLAARDSFRAFVTQADLSTAESLAETIGRSYEEGNGWSEIADLLTAGASPRMGRMMESMMGRSPMMMGPTVMLPVDEAPLVILSPTGRPVLDLRSEGATTNLDVLSPTDGAPVVAGERRVGYLFFGSMIDGNLTSIQAEFLRSTLTATVFSAVAVAITASLLGWVLLRRLTLPLAELADAAQSISRGNLAHEISPRGDDEIGELANAFRDMRESLARSEDTRKRMLRDLAHEIRTPVTLLAGELEAIRDGIYKADKSTLDSLYQEVTLLATLVEDLSVLASADAKELSLDTGVVSARELLQTAARRNAGEARSAGVSIDVDAPKDLLVDVDDTRIQQVLANLIGNSLRHGGTVSRVRLSAHRDTEGSVEFRVADDGKGVEENDLPFLFDRLYRAERSRSRGGSGLGLSISKSIIEAHDGQIRAFSGEKRGLVVAFWLRERS